MDVPTQILKYGGTATGAVAGWFVFGPLGSLIGAGVGVGVDFLRAQSAGPPSSPGASIPAPAVVTPVSDTHVAVAAPPVVMAALTPGAPALPAGADLNAASQATHLMLLGGQAEVAPAATSVLSS